MGYYGPLMPLAGASQPDGDATRRLVVRVSGDFDLADGTRESGTVQARFAAGPERGQAVRQSTGTLLEELSRGATVCLNGRSVAVQLRGVSNLEVRWEDAASPAPPAPPPG